MIRDTYALLGSVVHWGLERILGRMDDRRCDWANVTHEGDS